MPREKSKNGKSRPQPQPAPLTTGDKIRREVLSWLWVILAFLFIEGTLVQARVIPSGSMENTILIGDHLIVSRMGYDVGIPFTEDQVELWRKPKRQQIIVFEAPLPGSQDFIKRVIGVPGDHIRIVNQKVFVNGKPLNEPYALIGPAAPDTIVDDFPPTDTDLFDGRLTPEWAAQLPKHVSNGQLVVPPNDYFVMGDNRDNSYDSRYWGFVPRSDIIGTPLFIYLSIDAPEETWEPGHIFDRLGAYLDIFIHPSEMRWRRLFHTF